MTANMKRYLKRALGPDRIRDLQYLQCKTVEAFGSDRYSFRAMNGLDRKLSAHVTHEGGFFIEVGANDGFSQSNSYYLERFRNWRGILIEPIPNLYHTCCRIRKQSYVVNCALGSRDRHGSTLIMQYSNLTSAPKEIATDQGRQGWLDQGGTVYDVEVPVRTISSVVDEFDPVHIDILFLDVEGYEAEVLDGLDLRRHRPGWILVETDKPEQVAAQLESCYVFVERASHHDFLFRRRLDEDKARRSSDCSHK